MKRISGRELWLLAVPILLLVVVVIALVSQYAARTPASVSSAGVFGLTSPWPGTEVEHEGANLQAMMEYWHGRMTYPTGDLNPAWILQAAEKDRLVRSGVPAGRVVYDRTESRSPLGLDPLSFTSLGPKPLNWFIGNTSGRVNAIAVDPVVTSTSYLGVAGGGVWKATNCCSSLTEWTPVTDQPSVPSIGIGDLTIDPNNHNVIYAGTGDLNYTIPEYNVAGVLKSTDAGVTWNAMGTSVFNGYYPAPLGAPPETQAIGKVRVDPANSNKIVAGTKTGLYVSYDAGVNWTGPCFSNPYSATQRQDVTGLLLRDNGSFTELYVAQGTRGFSFTLQPTMAENGANGIYRAKLGSAGCPAGWALLTRPDNGWPAGTGSGIPVYQNGNVLGRIDMAFAPSTIGPGSPNVTIYAQVQSTRVNVGGQLGLWRSTDGGLTWEQRSDKNDLVPCNGSPYGDFPQNWFDQGLAVDPADPNNLYMDTFDLWHSSDGGTTLTDITCGYTVDAQVHVDHHAVVFRPGSSTDLLVGTDGGVYHTPDAGHNWEQLNDSLSTIEFYSGDITGNFANAVMPGAAGGMQDNGSAVSQWSGTPGPVAWAAVVGGDGFWSRIEPVLEQNWYVVSNGSRMFMSTNGPYGFYGEITGGWRSARHSSFLPYEIYKNDCPGSGCTHLIVGSSAVSETLTGGVPWVKVSPDFLGFINQLSYAVSLSTTAIIGTNLGQVVYGFGLGQGVMANWVDVTGGNAILPNRTILDVTTDPVNPLVGYAAVGGFEENTPGKPGHVFRVTCTATCASFTWADKTGNLPNVPIDSILANPLYPQQVFAGSDWGLYFTDDINAVSPVWQRFDVGLPHAFIFDMQIDRGFTTLSVWTRSRGAFAWPLPAGPIGGPTATSTPGAATPTRTVTPTRTATSVSTSTSTSTAISTVTSTSTSTAIGAATSTSTSTSIATATTTVTSTSTTVATSTASSTTVAATSTATACTILFTDVPVGSTFYSYIRCLACLGIINGYTSGCETGNPCFRPNNNVTRGQLSKIVSNAAGFSEPALAQQFQDVVPGSTFYDFVWRLAARGYVSGYPCGGAGEPCVGPGNLPYFRPNADVTRGQFSKIVDYAAGIGGLGGAQQFEDVLPGSTFYDFIWALADRGIVTGYPCGGPGEPCGGGNLPYFRPGATATRGQASKIVAGAFGYNCDIPSR